MYLWNLCIPGEQLSYWYSFSFSLLTTEMWQLCEGWLQWLCTDCSCCSQWPPCPFSCNLLKVQKFRTVVIFLVGFYLKYRNLNYALSEYPFDFLFLQGKPYILQLYIVDFEVSTYNVGIANTVSSCDNPSSVQQSSSTTKVSEIDLIWMKSLSRLL